MPVFLPIQTCSLNAHMLMLKLNWGTKNELTLFAQSPSMNNKRKLNIFLDNQSNCQVLYCINFRWPQLWKESCTLLT